MSDPTSEPPSEPEDDESQGRVLAVHVGHSANCSSIGSVVDFLFLSGVAGGAVLSVVALLLRERAKERAASAEPEKADGD